MDNIKGNRYYVEKIADDLSFVVAHTENLTKEQLEENEILLDSVMFRLIQISESSDKLTEEFKNKHGEIPWHAIRGLRNRIVHEYSHVDLGVIYDTVANDLPQLLNEIKKIL